MSLPIFFSAVCMVCIAAAFAAACFEIAGEDALIGKTARQIGAFVLVLVIGAAFELGRAWS
ncbi:hypothetical protein [Rhodocyclus tenuis]|uniref:Uncharacterized protein n=1 Tax=Rhodocyclus tenuis TaxID=1066 RepID=A0A840GA49_RHOTE|nr:hypothetical protein [Rhodocyclus tenuis]MBB4248351.1 hypothetical protein [Rhodocyclus tenuis]